MTLPQKIVTRILIVLLAFPSVSHALSQPASVSEFYVPATGARLFVRTIGQGEPLMILHGGPGFNHQYLQPWLDGLATRYRLIYFDQRGSGRSADSLDVNTITLSNFVDDIERIRMHLGLKKVSLLGHSFGAIPAIKYALKYPEHVNRLILVSPSPLSRAFDKEIGAMLQQHQTPADSAERQAILKSPAFAEGNTAAYEQLFRVLFRASFYNRQWADSLHLHLEPEFAAHARNIYRLSAEMTSFNLYPELATLTCPLLVIYGKQDMAPEQIFTEIQKYCPKASLRPIDKCGHFPFIEQRAQFMKLMR